MPEAIPPSGYPVLKDVRKPTRFIDGPYIASKPAYMMFAQKAGGSIGDMIAADMRAQAKAAGRPDPVIEHPENAHFWAATSSGEAASDATAAPVVPPVWVDPITGIEPPVAAEPAIAAEPPKPVEPTRPSDPPMSIELPAPVAPAPVLPAPVIPAPILPIPGSSALPGAPTAEPAAPSPSNAASARLAGLAARMSLGVAEATHTADDAPAQRRPAPARSSAARPLGATALLRRVAASIYARPGAETDLASTAATRAAAERRSRQA